MRVFWYRTAVHRPEESLVLALIGNGAHRAAAEDDPMPIRFGEIRYGNGVSREPRYLGEGSAKRRLRCVLNLQELVGALPIERIDDAMRAPRIRLAVENHVGAHPRPEHDAGGR